MAHAAVLPGPAALHGPAGAEQRALLGAAAPLPFASPHWLQATRHADAGAGQDCWQLVHAAEPPADCRLPHLLCMVSQLARTPAGDAAAQLSAPEGSCDALVMLEALPQLCVGCAVLLRGCSLLSPAFSPRDRVLLVCPENLAAVWLPAAVVAAVAAAGAEATQAATQRAARSAQQAATPAPAPAYQQPPVDVQPPPQAVRQVQPAPQPPAPQAAPSQPRATPAKRPAPGVFDMAALVAEDPDEYL